MVRNHYFRQVYSFKNPIKDNLLGFTLIICRSIRILLEAFVRRDFGRRYFSLLDTVLIVLILGAVPMIYAYGNYTMSQYGYAQRYDFWKFAKHFLTWYAFLAGFLYMANERRKEIFRLTAHFDFNHFSLSNGVVHPAFKKIVLNGKPADIRTIETLLEPGFFFGIGLLLWGTGQYIGPVLIVCALVHALSYMIEYKLADDAILDLIDEMIANREFVAAFVDGKETSETAGFRVAGLRPASQDFRRELADQVMVRDEIIEAR